MKELFEKVMNAYKVGDENLFAAAARNWAEVDQNPFKPNTSEYELYFNAAKAYKVWQSKAINSRVSKQQMIKYVRKIAEMNLENPYEEKKSKKEKKVIVEPAEHIFGVIPTQKLEIVESDEVLPPETDIEETEDKSKKKKHRFFKKEGAENDGE